MKTDNELIAEFMGLKRVEAGVSYNKAQYYKSDPKDLRKKGKFMGYFDGLKYDTSWDWLMPVVEKIRVYCSENPKKVKGEDIVMNLPITATISEVYSESVEFIKWYNNQK